VSKLASRRTRSIGRVFAVPMLLAVVTLAGLILGLAGDGTNDLFSWLLLALPIGALAFAWLKRS